MSFRFCGFEENTTVREIQEKFMEKEKCDEILCVLLYIFYFLRVH